MLENQTSYLLKKRKKCGS